MGFQEYQARYRRLFDENASWKLLQADNSPYILAFISDLFSEEHEVPYGRARMMLDAEIKRSHDQGIWETKTSAGTYLNQWIRKGWLREMNDMLTKTDASETALRFCTGLDERTSGTTASHLRIVQEAVRELAVAINPNINDRVASYESKKAEIQREIDALQAGVVTNLSECEQQERIKEIYQLSSVLTGDFRKVEDEIRQLDKDLRIQMIEEDSSRGSILRNIMEKEDLLSSTEAGSAFENFYQLLCDQNRSTEFREQLRSILNQPAAKQLSPAQHQFLGKLMRELTSESERVFHVRRKTEEGLRSFIENGAATENRNVDLLLSKLEKLALSIHHAEIDLRTETSLYLPVGPIEITSPESMKLKSPDDQLDTTNVKENENTRELSSHLIESLETVRIQEVVYQAHNTLKKLGPMSVAGLAQQHPLKSGLEELVAYIRIAKAVGSTKLDQREFVNVMDKQGVIVKASIPTYILSADLFPEQIDELTL